MSVKAMSAAFEAGDVFNLSAIDRLILLRIGDWADDNGYAFPGLGDLVRKCGVDERTVRRHISSMERGGFIIRVYGGGGRNRTTLYRILPEILPDDLEAPGRLRYEARFGKGDSLSGFINSRGGQTKARKGDRPGQKGGHSSVPRSISIHQDPSDDFQVEEVEPLLPGESQWERARRIALDI